SDHGLVSKFRLERDGKRLEQAVADLIAVLVVDQLEAMHLKRNHDEMIATLAGFGAELTSTVREPLAIIEAGNRIGGRKNRGSALFLRAHLGFVLEVHITPPSKQDERNVQGQRSAGETDVGAEPAVVEGQFVKEGATIPDQQHDRRN